MPALSSENKVTPKKTMSHLVSSVECVFRAVNTSAMEVLQSFANRFESRDS